MGAVGRLSIPAAETSGVAFGADAGVGADLAAGSRGDAVGCFGTTDSLGPVCGFGAAGRRGAAARFDAAGRFGVAARTGTARRFGVAARTGAADLFGAATGFDTLGFEPWDFTALRLNALPFGDLRRDAAAATFAPAAAFPGAADFRARSRKAD
jgi:hypothetical protein